MAIPSYIARNRHGTFYFRARIPKHLREHFPSHKREIKRSLQTDSERLAVIRARAFRVEFDTKMAELEKGVYRAFSVVLEGKRTVTLPDGTEKEIIARTERDLNSPNEDRTALRQQIAEQLREEELHENKLAVIREQYKSATAAAAPIAGPALRPAMLSEVIRKFVKHKLEEDGHGWNDGGVQQQGRLKTILEIIGDKSCRELTELDAIKVEETIPKLPLRLNQGFLANLPNLQAKIETDHTEFPRLDRNTQSKYWEIFCQLIDFAKKKKFLATDITESCFGISFSKEEKKESEYDRFTDAELHRIFTGHVYQPNKLRGTKGHSYHFWLPLLAAYTGARQNELCQLLVSDIKKSEDEIWYIDITDEEEHDKARKKSKDKSFKSVAAKRLVPIHHQLIKLGFLEFVQEERTGPSAHMLFNTGLSCSGHGKWNKNASKWFNGEAGKEDKKVRGTKGYKQHCGFDTNTGKVFHSFRKSFATNLYNKEVNIEQLSKLIGHESEHKTTHIYIKEIELAPLKEYIDKLDYDIDLSHVSYETFKKKFNL